MPKTIHPRSSRWFWTFVLVSALVLPALQLGAQATPTPTPQPTPTPTPQPTVADLRVKVKVVEVTISGNTLQVNPETVRLKRREEVVNWVTNGTSMRIAFRPTPGNPFTDLTCRGRFCGVLTPPDVLGTFKYTVTVDGVSLDPNVEVIP